MERDMMPGDIPCEAPCAARWCPWNLGGRCVDNETCEGQMKGDEK